MNRADVEPCYQVAEFRCLLAQFLTGGIGGFDHPRVLLRGFIKLPDTDV